MKPSKIAVMLTNEEHEFVIRVLETVPYDIATSIIQKFKKTCTCHYEVVAEFDRKARFPVDIGRSIDEINEKLDDAMYENGDLHSLMPDIDKGKNLESIGYIPVGISITDDQDTKIWLEASGSIENDEFDEDDLDED